MELPLWSWLIEPMAIDFANSTRRDGMVDREYFRTGEDVASWCEHEDGRVPRVSAASAGERLEEIRAVRDDIKAVLRATVDGVPLPARATARVNAGAGASSGPSPRAAPAPSTSSSPASPPRRSSS
jgi:hypothetical protein